MKTIKRLLGTILILLTVVFQSKSQDLVVESNDKIIYRKNSSSPAFMTLDTDNGRVGIGTSNPQQALEVNGKVLIRDRDEFVTIGDHPYNLWVTDGIVAEDLFIVNRTSWAYYVFEDDYNLMSLEDLEKFIQSNKHLPNIPSAEEVKEAGYSQHHINEKLLSKVEELVLYTLKQEKDLKHQVEIISDQSKQIDKLMKLVDQQNSTTKTDN
jgi:hypothetical protein